MLLSCGLQPANIKNVTFELWGAGAAGVRGCCCMWSSRMLAAEAMQLRSMSVVAGCPLTICAAGNGNCCERDCLGYDGSNKLRNWIRISQQRVLEEDVQEEQTVC